MAAPVMLSLLDLTGLRAHWKNDHPKQAAPPRISLEGLARIHAQAHGEKLAGHTHGGFVISVEFPHAMFSVHPEGFFTGADMDGAARNFPSPRAAANRQWKTPLSEDEQRKRNAAKAREYRARKKASGA